MIPGYTTLWKWQNYGNSKKRSVVAVGWWREMNSDAQTILGYQKYLYDTIIYTSLYHCPDAENINNIRNREN